MTVTGVRPGAAPPLVRSTKSTRMTVAPSSLVEGDIWFPGAYIFFAKTSRVIRAGFMAHNLPVVLNLINLELNGQTLVTQFAPYWAQVPWIRDKLPIIRTVGNLHRESVTYCGSTRQWFFIVWFWTETHVVNHRFDVSKRRFFTRYTAIAGLTSGLGIPVNTDVKKRLILRGIASLTDLNRCWFISESVQNKENNFRS